MFTSAPDLVSEFLKIIFAKFFSKSVFPIKIPSPSPDLVVYSFTCDLLYGSPILLITSFG